MEWSDSRILVIEDCEKNMRLFQRLLVGSGFDHVVGIRDSRQALDTFLGFEPDLVLLDLHMPHVDGFQVMELLQAQVPEDVFLPILVITGDMEPAVRVRCLSAGAKDFVSKPFRADELLARIGNLLETRQLHRFLKRRNETLEIQVRQESSKLRETQLEILQRLAVAAEYRDECTGRHAERVGILAESIGREVGLGEEELDFLRKAAPLHDVGKIGIPDSILLKPGKLSEEDFETIKTHTTIGGLILSRDSFPLLGYARTIALTHHERWDGTGYPEGLAGEDIPLCGRIVAVADVFDSVVHERSYKPAIPVDRALEIMLAQRSLHFDAALLDPFVELVRSGRVSDVLAESEAGRPSDSRTRQRPPSVHRAPPLGASDRAPLVQQVG
jgi:putative two-component system response regulator